MALASNRLAPGVLRVQAAKIRIGARGSRLAQAQAREVQERLLAAHGADTLAFELRAITTTGDRIQDRTLADAGGKGLFTKEIEDALLAGEIDLAVHSMKDMPTVLPPGLALACFLPREDVRDAFISPRAAMLGDLPKGAVLATSSLRRAAQARWLRPDLTVVPMRGNVETRLRKLEQGVADATLLAMAGLKRLGLAGETGTPVPVDDMLPAVAQGAIGVEIRAGDARAAALLAPINHEPTALAVTAERAFLAKLEGSCRMPIAGLGEAAEGRFLFRGMVLSPDGRERHATRREGRAAEAIVLAEDAAAELLASAGRAFS
ncbi:MAG TPA: hydroxymethylbilane synthase [Hyphomicrobiaceae bacterium]|nr:hydroxymethylbilane synthase [Hyphomicrobiaceae bacterium]